MKVRCRVHPYNKVVPAGGKWFAGIDLADAYCMGGEGHHDLYIDDPHWSALVRKRADVRHAKNRVARRSRRVNR